MVAAVLLARQSLSRRAVSSGAASAVRARTASSWARASSSQSSSQNAGAAAGSAAVFLLLAAGGVAVVRPVEEGGESGALCGPSKVHHTLFVTGSASGRGMRETVVGVPKEVALPGQPGRIDGVAFGPSWVAVAKEGAVYVSTAIGAAAADKPQTLTLHAPGGGWFGGPGRAGVVQVACGRHVIYGRTAGGQVLYWKRREGEGEELGFDGPYQYAGLKRAGRVTHVAAGPEHAVFLTQDGAAFAVGNNADGRLGVGEGEELVGEGVVLAAPAPVQVPGGVKIVGASCGGTHTLLLDDAGGAYACGSDYWLQLGLGETWKVVKDRPQANFPVPKKVRQFEEVQVVGLAAGGSHSLFSVAFPGHWLERGRLEEKIKTPARVLEAWACGFGQYGSLGDRAYIHLSPPKRIRELRLMTHPDTILPAIHVACGENHSAALLLEPLPPPPDARDANGDAPPLSYALKGPALGPPPPKDLQIQYKPALYVWGHNLGAQCGTGKPGNLARPTAPQVVDPARVDAVVCGFDYTGFVQRQEGK